MEKSKSNIWIYAYLGFLGLIIALFIYYFYGDSNKETYYIGLSGPLSGKNKELGTFMKRGAELAIEEINKSGKLKGIELKLLAQDDKSEYSSAYIPQEAAKKICKNKKVLAVVGHYFSGPTIAAAHIYEKNRIPVISPTATHPDATANSDWVFSVVFNDNFQTRFLANYVSTALNKKKIAVLYTKMPYGKALKDNFIDELKLHGRKPIYVYGINPKNFNVENLKEHLSQLEKADIIFLSMRYDNAAMAVKYLKTNGVETDYIGGENIGSQRFIDLAGIYADNVYAVTSFLPNLLGKEARLYQKNFQDKYLIEPDWASAHSYEAVNLIANGIEWGGANSSSIRNYLKKLKSPYKAAKSIGGKIYFNKTGSCLRPITIGQVKNNRYSSSEFQLVSVKYPYLMKKEGKGSQLIEFQNRYLKRSTVVFTGIKINKIDSFYVTEGTFRAEFLLWFRWKGKDIKNIDFELENGIILDKEKLEEYYNPETEDSFVSYNIRASLTGNFPLHLYPFDKQTLKIKIKCKRDSVEDILLVRDLAEQFQIKSELDLGIWIDNGHVEYVDLINEIYSFRNPKFNNDLFELDYSLFNYHINVKRRVLEYMIKLIPLLIVVLVAYLVFYVDIDKYTPSRLAMGITALLSAVAFHMSQSSNVGKIGYLIKSDYFFMLTYLMIFLTIVETVMASFLVHKGGLKKAQMLDNVSAFLFPVLLTMFLILIYY